MRSPRQLLSTLALVALVAAGCSGGHHTTSASSGNAMVVKITMRDNAYEPSEVTVPKGRDVTFEFTNEGTVEHEALVGDAESQVEHIQEMANQTSEDSGDMEGMHHAGAAGAVTLKPGESDRITMSFDESGTVLIGCHVPLHYEQGMKATVNVA